MATYTDVKQRIVFCKVCTAAVSKRKRYHPSTCEACMKFFTRTRKRPSSEIVCLSGSLNCPVNANRRRFCIYCRYHKCLDVGMQPKLHSHRLAQTSASTFGKKDDIQEDRSNQPDEKQGTLCELVVIPKDPILYDGSFLEEIVRNSIHSFTLLNDLESVPIKRYDSPTVDLPTIGWLMKSQFLQTVSTAIKYTKHMGEAYDWPSDERNKFTGVFLMPMSIAFSSLPANSTSLQMSEALWPTFLALFPHFKALRRDAAELSAALCEWQPTLVECALFFAILPMIGNTSNRYYHKILRQHLMQAFSVYCSSISKSGRSVDEALSQFSKCLKLVIKTTRCVVKCLEQDTNNAVPLYSSEEMIVFKKAVFSWPCELNFTEIDLSSM